MLLRQLRGSFPPLEMLQKIQFQYKNRPRGWLNPLKVLPGGKVLLVADTKFRFELHRVQLRSHACKIVIELTSKACDLRNDLHAVPFNQAETKLCQHAQGLHELPLHLIRIAFRPKAVENEARGENAQEYTNNAVAGDSEVGLDRETLKIDEVKRQRGLQAEIGKSRT